MIAKYISFIREGRVPTTTGCWVPPTEEGIVPTSDDLQHGINTRQLTMIGIGKAIGARLFVGDGKEIAAAGPDITFAHPPSDLVTIYMLAELSTATPEVGPFFELHLPRTRLWNATLIELLRRIARRVAKEDEKEAARAPQRPPRDTGRRSKDPARAEDTADIDGVPKVRQASADAARDRPRLEITTRPEPHSSQSLERNDSPAAHANRENSPIGYDRPSHLATSLPSDFPISAAENHLALSTIAKLKHTFGPDADPSSLVRRIKPDLVIAATHARAMRNAQWRHTLLPSEQSAAARTHPHLIGDADDIPSAARARAMELLTWR
ncbi:hypothetical protein ACWEO2_06820 [Nocardia sp. NPDC004278]